MYSSKHPLTATKDSQWRRIDLHSLEKMSDVSSTCSVAPDKRATRPSADVMELSLKRALNVALCGIIAHIFPYEICILRSPLPSFSFLTHAFEPQCKNRSDIFGYLKNFFCLFSNNIMLKELKIRFIL